MSTKKLEAMLKKLTDTEAQIKKTKIGGFQGIGNEARKTLKESGGVLAGGKKKRKGGAVADFAGTKGGAVADFAGTKGGAVADFAGTKGGAVADFSGVKGGKKCKGGRDIGGVKTGGRDIGGNKFTDFFTKTIPDAFTKKPKWVNKDVAKVLNVMRDKVNPALIKSAKWLADKNIPIASQGANVLSTIGDEYLKLMPPQGGSLLPDVSIGGGVITTGGGRMRSDYRSYNSATTQRGRHHPMRADLPYGYNPTDSEVMGGAIADFSGISGGEIANFAGGSADSSVLLNKLFSSLQKALSNHPDKLSQIVGKIMKMLGGSKRGRGVCKCGNCASCLTRSKISEDGDRKFDLNEFENQENMKKYGKSKGAGKKGSLPASLQNWKSHLDAFRQQHPEMKLSDAMKAASKTYIR